MHWRKVLACSLLCAAAPAVPTEASKISLAEANLVRMAALTSMAPKQRVRLSVKWLRNEAMRQWQ
jgi:hypothetical protein